MTDPVESGPWLCERDDNDGLFVYDADAAGFERRPYVGFQTELAAWEHGLDCLLIRRDQITTAIKDARSEVRRLRRKKS